MTRRTADHFHPPGWRCVFREGREQGDTGIVTGIAEEVYQPSGRFALLAGHADCQKHVFLVPAPSERTYTSYTPRCEAALYFHHISGDYITTNRPVQNALRQDYGKDVDP